MTGPGGAGPASGGPRVPALRDAVRGAAALLAEAGVPSPEVDARLLAEHLLGRPLALAPALDDLPDGGAGFLAAFADLVARRAAREPLQHLTGVMHFRHLTLPAGPGVFVVRPETELLVDEALALLRELAGEGPARVVDLCTGSGAIALSLATERAGTEVWAVELSGTAARAAATSAADHAGALPAGSALEVLRGDATDPAVLAHLDGTVDVVVSNPPYIPPDAVPRDPEVRDHDPDLALYGGGVDGLEIPARVLARAWALLRPGGAVVMEHAEVQAAALRAIAQDAGWAGVRTVVDLAGSDRHLVARKP